MAAWRGVQENAYSSDGEYSDGARRTCWVPEVRELAKPKFGFYYHKYWRPRKGRKPCWVEVQWEVEGVGGSPSVAGLCKAPIGRFGG
jgi:hypothetical protein